MSLSFVPATSLLKTIDDSDELYFLEEDDEQQSIDLEEVDEQEQLNQKLTALNLTPADLHKLCSICFEEFDSDDKPAIELPYCKHRFCGDCLSGYSAFELGKHKILDIRFYKGSVMNKRIDNSFELKEFVDHGLKCPAKSCNHPLPRKLMSPDISCNSKAFFYVPLESLQFYDQRISEKCPKGCGLEKHESSCDDYRSWLLNNAISDVAFGFYAFKASNLLRPCPYCKAPVEKNGGCSHMRCTRCNKDYNWNQCRLYVESKTAWSNSLTKSLKLPEVDSGTKKHLEETLKTIDATLTRRQASTKRTGRRKGARRRGMLANRSSTVFQDQVAKLYRELEVVVKK